MRAQSLNIIGGNYKSGEKVQGFPGNFHGDSYSDASHGIRLVKNGSLMVNGKPMSWEDFHSNPEYAKEFGFHLIPKSAKYASTPALDAFVEANKPKGREEEKGKKNEPIAVAEADKAKDESKKDKPKSKTS